MWGSPSSPQINQKYIYMWNTSYKTPTECWQKTSDLPKGKKHPTYLGRAKKKRIYNGEKAASSISGAGKTGQLHVKE